MSHELVILHGGALGDLALTIRLALSLTGRLPDSPLHVISRTNPGDLTRFRPSVRWTSSETLETHWLFRNDDAPPPPRLENAVRGRLVLSALGEFNGPVHRRLCSLGPMRVLSFDPRPREDFDGHILSQWTADLPPDSARGHPLVTPALAADASFAAECRAALASRLGWGPRVLIHPGSGGEAKCWPLVLFISVATALRNAGCGVAMIIGPAERERWRSGEIETARDVGIHVFELEGTGALVRMLVGADVFIGNDCGPSHVAALVGTPTVSLFGPTPTKRWQPLGSAPCMIPPQAIQGDAGVPGWGIDPRDVFQHAMTMVRMCEISDTRGRSSASGG